LVPEDPIGSRPRGPSTRPLPQVIVIVVLSLFPGEPYDYEFQDGNTAALKTKREEPAGGDKAAEHAPDAAAGLPAAADAVVDKAAVDKVAADSAAAAAAAADSIDKAPKKEPKEKLTINAVALEAKAKRAENLLGIPANVFKQAVQNGVDEANKDDDDDADAGNDDAFSSGFGWAMWIPLLAIAVCVALYHAPEQDKVAEAHKLLSLAAKVFPREAKVFRSLAAK